jgi:LacI family transcriptional regulator
MTINDKKLPVVLLDKDVCNSGGDVKVDVVLNDNFNGSYKMVNYLISLGHENIAIIASRNAASPISSRMERYTEALEDNGIEINENNILYGNSSYESGYKLTKELITQPKTPSAVFIVNNIMSMGAVSALNEMKMSIPDKISVCAFGQFKYHGVLNPDLTVADQHSYETGKTAAEILMQKIQNYRNWEPKKVVFEGNIIMRNSCSRPR